MDSKEFQKKAGEKPAAHAPKPQRGASAHDAIEPPQATAPSPVEPASRIEDATRSSTPLSWESRAEAPPAEPPAEELPSAPAQAQAPVDRSAVRVLRPELKTVRALDGPSLQSAFARGAITTLRRGNRFFGVAEPVPRAKDEPFETHAATDGPEQVCVIVRPPAGTGRSRRWLCDALGTPVAGYLRLLGDTSTEYEWAPPEMERADGCAGLTPHCPTIVEDALGRTPFALLTAEGATLVWAYVPAFTPENDPDAPEAMVWDIPLPCGVVDKTPALALVTDLEKTEYRVVYRPGDRLTCWAHTRSQACTRAFARVRFALVSGLSPDVGASPNVLFGCETGCDEVGHASVAGALTRASVKVRAEGPEGGVWYETGLDGAVVRWGLDEDDSRTDFDGPSRERHAAGAERLRQALRLCGLTTDPLYGDCALTLDDEPYGDRVDHDDEEESLETLHEWAAASGMTAGAEVVVPGTTSVLPGEGRITGVVNLKPGQTVVVAPTGASHVNLVQRLVLRGAAFADKGAIAVAVVLPTRLIARAQSRARAPGRTSRHTGEVSAGARYDTLYVSEVTPEVILLYGVGGNLLPYQNELNELLIRTAYLYGSSYDRYLELREIAPNLARLKLDATYAGLTSEGKAKFHVETGPSVPLMPPSQKLELVEILERTAPADRDEAVRQLVLKCLAGPGRPRGIGHAVVPDRVEPVPTTRFDDVLDTPLSHELNPEHVAQLRAWIDAPDPFWANVASLTARTLESTTAPPHGSPRATPVALDREPARIDFASLAGALLGGRALRGPPGTAKAAEQGTLLDRAYRERSREALLGYLAAGGALLSRESEAWRNAGWTIEALDVPVLRQHFDAAHTWRDLLCIAADPSEPPVPRVSYLASNWANVAHDSAARAISRRQGVFGRPIGAAPSNEPEPSGKGKGKGRGAERFGRGAAEGGRGGGRAALPPEPQPAVASLMSAPPEAPAATPPVAGAPPEAKAGPSKSAVEVGDAQRTKDKELLRAAYAGRVPKSTGLLAIARALERVRDTSEALRSWDAALRNKGPALRDLASLTGSLGSLANRVLAGEIQYPVRSGGVPAPDF